VDVDQSFTPDELNNFVRWVHSLNSTVGLSLEGVYETYSDGHRDVRGAALVKSGMGRYEGKPSQPSPSRLHRHWSL
jgi:hypothetical protein